MRHSLRWAATSARCAVVLAALCMAALQAVAQTFPRPSVQGIVQGIELYDAARFGGERLKLDAAATDLANYGYKNRTQSVVVLVGHWEVCDQPQFGGTCLTLAPGRYETMPVALNARIASVRPLAGAAVPVTAPVPSPLPSPVPLPIPTPIPTPAASGEAAALTLYRDTGAGGRSVAVNGPLANLGSVNFNDEVTSIDIRRGRWQLCVNSDFGGSCQVFGPGRHELSGRFHDGVSSLRPVVGPQDQPLPASGGVVLHEDIDFNGRELLRLDATRNLRDFGFNDRASSIDVLAGRWELCSDADFSGTCVLFGPGRHRLDATLGDRLSSLRPR